MSGGPKDRIDGVTVEAPGTHLRAKLGRGLVGSQRRSVRARLAHRVVDVRGRQDPVSRRQGGRGQTTGISRTVKSLVVTRRDLAAGCERRDPGQHLVGEVGMLMRAFAFDIAERTRLVPDRVGDPEPTEIVQQPRAAQRHPQHLREAGDPPSLGRQVGDTSRVPREVPRLEVDQVRHRLQHVVELGTRHPACEPWLGVQDLVPRRRTHQVVEPLSVTSRDGRGMWFPRTCLGPLPSHCS